MDTRYNDILHLIDKNELQQAIVELDSYILECKPKAEAFMMRGKAYWKLGKHREAINDYHRALELEPDGPARQAIDNAMAILDFYHTDIYNP